MFASVQLNHRPHFEGWWRLGPEFFSSLLMDRLSSLIRKRALIVAKDISVQSIKGMLIGPCTPVSIELMNQVIAGRGAGRQ